MAKEDKFADKMLTDDELDQVAGGITGVFLPNQLDNFFDKDEFWYKGEKIGHDKAIAVGMYFKYNKKLPETSDDAVHWYENDFLNKAPKN